MHPASRQRYTHGAPEPLRRTYVETKDGWRLPLFHVAPVAGGAGEPVLLLHTLGIGPDAFRYGPEGNLVKRLTEAGFSVYLGSYRGDHEAVAPPSAEACCFDDVVDFDMEAMVDAVLEHSGYAKVFLLGHGLGGQAALGWIGRFGDGRVAATAVLSAPVAFDTAPKAVQRILRTSTALPAAWRWKTDIVGKIAAAFVELDHERGLSKADASLGSRLRGVLTYATEDIPVGMLQQMQTWFRAGALVGHHGLHDYGVALGQASTDLWVGVGVGDTWAPPEWSLPVRALWGGKEVTTQWYPDSFGHLDVVLHPDADAQLFAPLRDWLVDRRRKAWGRGAA